MEPRKQWLWVGLACLLFLGQELVLLQTRWVEDESWQCTSAYALVTEGRNRNPTFIETDHEAKVTVKPPGHALLLATIFKLFGTGLVQARMPSILAGLAVVIVTFLLGRQLVSPVAGIVAGLLVATDNLLFLAGRTARPEVFVTLLQALGLWFYVVSRRDNSWQMAALSGVSVGAAICFHHTGMAAVGAIGVLLLWEFKFSVWRQPRAWSFAAGVALLVVPMVLWIVSTPTHREAAKFLYVTVPHGLTKHLTLIGRIREEIVQRYADFVQFPYRIHVAVLIIASFGVLAIKNRALLAILLPVVFINLVWLLYAYNKTVRYFVILAPFFALTVSCATIALWQRKSWARAAAVVCVLFGLSQIAGNMVFVYRFREANYLTVQTKLRELVPIGESVFGAITFWMALHDRTYYSYERTPFEHTITKQRPTYMILNDRLMVKGMGRGLDDWAELRVAANAYARNHGELVGRISNAFYGDLEIYRLRYASQ